MFKGVAKHFNFMEPVMLANQARFFFFSVIWYHCSLRSQDTGSDSDDDVVSLEHRFSNHLPSVRDPFSSDLFYEYYLNV